MATLIFLFSAISLFRLNTEIFQVYTLSLCFDFWHRLTYTRMKLSNQKIYCLTPVWGWGRLAKWVGGRTESIAGECNHRRYNDLKTNTSAKMGQRPTFSRTFWKSKQWSLEYGNEIICKEFLTPGFSVSSCWLNF